MDITLYHGEPNGPSLTVLAALNETNVSANLVAIDLTMAERHLSTTPSSVEADLSVEGEGPILVVDGEAMADSVFITRFLDTIGTGTSLTFDDSLKQWEMMNFCRYTIERVAPAAAFLGTKAYLNNTLSALSDEAFEKIILPIRSQDLKARWVDIRNNVFSDEQTTDSQKKIAAAVEKIEGQLADKDWLMEAFSIADLEAYSWLAGMVELVPSAFENAPKTQAWLARVNARPSVQAALAVAKVDQPQNIWAPGPEINRWG